MAKKCGRGKIWRKGYTTKKGTKVKGACIIDRGKPGKGPKTLPKPTAGALKGWGKGLSQKERMRILKSLTKEKGCATVIRDLNLLSNITTDKPTRKAAVLDMRKLHDQPYCKLITKRK